MREGRKEKKEIKGKERKDKRETEMGRREMEGGTEKETERRRRRKDRE